MKQILEYVELKLIAAWLMLGFCLSLAATAIARVG